MKIAAAVAYGPRQPFRIEAVDLEEPRADEVLVRMVAVGLCHGDIAFRDLSPHTEFPIVLGHEGAGVVERVGASVGKVAPGDHVGITFQSCGRCARCTEGDVAHCLDFARLNYAGRRPDGSKAIKMGGEPVSSHFFAQSSFATFALANERNVVKVPDDMPLELVGPLGCSVQTGAGAIIRSLACAAQEPVLILGCGAVGLSAVMAAAARGCHPIIVAEPLESRRRLAARLGATHLIDPRLGEVASAVRAIVPDGVLYAFDTSGRSDMLEAAFEALTSHGTLAVAAAADGVQRLPGNLFNLIAGGRSIKGINEGDSDPDVFIPELIDLYRAGKLPVDLLITTFPLGQINEAIESQRMGDCVKVVLLTEGASAEA